MLWQTTGQTLQIMTRKEHYMPWELQVTIGSPSMQDFMKIAE